jgi:hypothetical protein
MLTKKEVLEHPFLAPADGALPPSFLPSVLPPLLTWPAGVHPGHDCSLHLPALHDRTHLHQEVPVLVSITAVAELPASRLALCSRASGTWTTFQQHALCAPEQQLSGCWMWPHSTHASETALLTPSIVINPLMPSYAADPL